MAIFVDDLRHEAEYTPNKRLHQWHAGRKLRGVWSNVTARDDAEMDRVVGVLKAARRGGWVKVRNAGGGKRPHLRVTEAARQVVLRATSLNARMIRWTAKGWP